MSPPGYPSAWLRPRRARFRFARQDHCSSATTCRFSTSGLLVIHPSSEGVASPKCNRRVLLPLRTLRAASRKTEYLLLWARLVLISDNRLHCRINLMAIGFKRQRRRYLRNCRITLVRRMPVLPEVNRNTNRDAAVGQDDFPRVTIGISVRSGRL